MLADTHGPELIRYVECPRDAWQGLPGVIPTDVKVSHLRRLLGAGFRHLDLGSFVSPSAVPQWADTDTMLAGLPRPHGADFLCIVGNQRGLQRAIASPAVSSVGFPFSVNDRFQRRNLGRSVSESWPLLEELIGDAARAERNLVVYVSMAFGNPYGEAWSADDTASMVERLRYLGIQRIALADTVGTADAARVEQVLSAVTAPDALGLHLHARPDAWQEPLEVALEAGVRWFEGALAGIGGCPFADDVLVGNLPTEKVLPWLASHGFQTGVQPDDLPALATEAATLAAEYGAVA